MATLLFGVHEADAQMDDTSRFANLEPAFRAVYDSDSCDKSKQSWPDYYSHWLHLFYLGGNGQTGWFASERVLTARISQPAQATLMTRLDTLGMRVGGEWAKANSCRKIRSTTAFPQSLLEPGKPALDQLANELLVASRADLGNGDALGHAIDDVKRQVDAVLLTEP